MGFFDKVKNNFKKVTNKTYLDAVIAGCVLVAYADGSISAEEKQKSIGLIQRNPSLSAFDIHTITERYNYFVEQVEFDFNVGKKQLMAAIEKVRSNREDADMCVTIMCSIGMADGDFSNTEKSVVRQICTTLGLNAGQYGL